MKSQGLKHEAWQKVMMALRNSVRDSMERPHLADLRARQETYLLDEKRMDRYVINKNPCQLDALQCAIVEYLLWKTKGKPHKFGVARLLVMQRVVLLTEQEKVPGKRVKQEITNNVIKWWDRQPHPSVEN